jgi:hypothetical protein
MAESMQRKSGRRILVPILLMVIAVGAAGLYWWYTQSVPAQQYAAYSKYGFSFQYPLGMTVSDQGATDNSGIAAFELKNDRHELVAVSWSRQVVPDLWASLDKALKEIAEMGCMTEFERGELGETTMGGHQMIQQNFIIVSNGEKLFGIYGVWYCTANQKLYLLNVYSNQGNDVPIFQRYVDSFVCH